MADELLDIVYPHRRCDCGKRIRLGGGHRPGDAQYGRCAKCGFWCKELPAFVVFGDPQGAQRQIPWADFRESRERLIAEPRT
jgi:hypothetical protein